MHFCNFLMTSTLQISRLDHATKIFICNVIVHNICVACLYYLHLYERISLLATSHPMIQLCALTLLCLNVELTATGKNLKNIDSMIDESRNHNLKNLISFLVIKSPDNKPNYEHNTEVWKQTIWLLEQFPC